VHAIGAGPEPIPVKKLSVENLTRAILEADDNVVRERAQVIGHEIRSEDGVGKSIDWIGKYSNEFLRWQI
jgi:sterol 3beta-glucosyltransferase